MKKITLIFTSLVALVMVSVPALIASAEVTTFKQLVDTIFINGIIKPIVPLLVGLAVVMFIYGVLILMFSEGGEKKEEGKQYMLWGIIGIFVMVSVWGLVTVLTNTFNLDNEARTVKIELKN